MAAEHGAGTQEGTRVIHRTETHYLSCLGAALARRVSTGLNVQAPREERPLQWQMAETGEEGGQQKGGCKDLVLQYAKSGRSVIPAKQMCCTFY